MLKIGEDVYRAFVDKEWSDFFQGLADFLRTHVSDLAQEPHDQLMQALRQLAGQAQAFGMVSEQAIAAYAITAAHLGLDFVAEFPGAREILEADLSEEDKSALLEAFTLNLFETLEQ